MLKDLKRIVEQNELIEADHLRRAAAVLLERQFLYSDADKDRKVYSALVNFSDYYRSLFDAMNHEYIHDREIGMVGILPRGRTNSLRLKKEEALLLLTLRLVYEDALENFRIKNNCAYTNSEKVLAKYEVSTGVDKRPLLTELRRILNDFRRMGVIDDIEENERVIDFRIRPAIRYVLNESWFRTLEVYAGIQSAGNLDPAEVDEIDAEEIEGAQDEASR
ncbi:protein of unknown function [Geoalkalibacter ferrihydriticus]|uniref:DUF4194 domain-containing protein n=1 Tax=Geoalkalibacter ferrihydriticus TaxID=392333 RepID=A0A1G9IHQ4_9BACT|nr:DUF4194 domain-containing protein [Geoalkalibacter ferrihydriticus]SDL24717.1 protein of unknown function [Geoalkalibacter ferrihydriticus]